jgi:flagellar biogenesis protein FliO
MGGITLSQLLIVILIVIAFFYYVFKFLKK